MAVTNINLIATKTDDNQQLARATAFLTKISYAGVLILLVLGVAMGGIYTYLQLRTKALVSQKNILLQAVAADSAKEGLLRALRDRIIIVDKLASTEKHVDNLFAEVLTIAGSGSIRSVSLDDTNKVILIMQIGSIDQAIAVTETLIKEALAGSVSKPFLTGLSIAKDGGFNLSLSYVQRL